jgi:hypothetical protein
MINTKTNPMTDTKTIGRKAIGSDRFIGGHITGTITADYGDSVVLYTETGWSYECPKNTLTYLP